MAYQCLPHPYLLAPPPKKMHGTVLVTKVLVLPKLQILGNRVYIHTYIPTQNDTGWRLSDHCRCEQLNVEPTHQSVSDLCTTEGYGSPFATA